MHIYRRVPRLALEPPVSLPQQQSLTRKMFRPCWAIHDGWNIYFASRVWPAGLGLAFLYMTVLGFGGVTNTYTRTQGLSESVISVAMGAGAAMGITGTLVFPRMRKRWGLERTGLVAVVAQFLPLMLCIVSIWLPGSPFDPHFYSRPTNETVVLPGVNTTAVDMDARQWITKPTEELLSVMVFLVGMIVARFGLWLADLTISQLMQEAIGETERGIVGGVQSSFNRLMDMLKFILVIGLPDPQTFGFLIILSCAFVATGHVFYACFALRSRRQSWSPSLPVELVTRGGQRSPTRVPEDT